VLLAHQQKQDLLLRDNEVAMLNKEKEIQKLQLQKNDVDYALQKSEADKKQEQLTVLNKEKTLQNFELKKQKAEKKYLIAGLILILVLSFFVYSGYRTRQKLKLQTLRNKIASDLHDDVGSTLSSISIFSQMALEETIEVRPMLQTIGESSSKMLDAMADIVWTINPDNDQFEKIIMRMRSFAYELLGAKRIEFRFVADNHISSVRLSMEARRNLYLIFKEATNNLVKYADATQAMFSIKEDKGKLVMMIKDNGRGFDSHNESKGNGLRNMKKRAADLGGILLINSIPGTGTTIQLELAV
jgi:signal transduction histidine kinase